MQSVNMGYLEQFKEIKEISDLIDEINKVDKFLNLYDKTGAYEFIQ